jgi:L-fucose mutarotase
MTILRGIPSVLNPDLLYALAKMGHGDEIVLADANFPSASVAKHTTLGKEIRCDGTSIPELLKAILELFPLDPAVDAPCFTSFSELVLKLSIIGSDCIFVLLLKGNP